MTSCQSVIPDVSKDRGALIPATLPLGKTRYPLYRRLCRPQVRSGQDFIYGREGTTESPYLSLGLSLREDATDTLADDWLLSLCASLSSRRYSSPELKGNGVTLSGVWLLVGWALSSTHDSAIRRHPVF